MVSNGTRPRRLSLGRVALDKSEVSVKGVVLLGSAPAPLASPERLRTKTLEISRGITLRWIREAPIAGGVPLGKYPKRLKLAVTNNVSLLS